MKNSRIFKPNGGAPSLSQVVRIAQAYVTPRTRQRARSIDYKVYSEKTPKRHYDGVSRRKSKYEKLDEKYSARIFK